jgi:hypothetical protein
MLKKTNKYKLKLDTVELFNEPETKNSLELEFTNHDNIFQIIETLKGKNLFPDENQATEFAIGLKLFSEVLIKNKDNELFTEFSPAFSSFMRKLKSK